MFTNDSLKDLYSLNWLGREAARLPEENERRQAMVMQMEALRRKLPVSLVSIHDRMAKSKRPSVARVSGQSCGACHLRLPVGTSSELKVPGRFVTCPNCGVFLTELEAAVEATAGL